ncbi:baseplate J/gp47 family protein [Variovorax sp. YR216]|uniref:baseplate assembly protein n=1 Tax=Variovorax sp. YR216 TaxID=1882828 RepID=UPI0008981ECB|nr:baseplate J/gp47 family protein [Variovorax sp. YR216]SEA50518.1 Phage-related baseplate assembly protein [Variovorax sp. YR216]
MTMDLTLLPAPKVIESLDYEVIFDRLLARFRELHPDFTLVLESDPAVKLLEVMAWQELLMRQRINDAARASMLAYAVGSDLDQLAANLGVARLVVTPANPNAVPPVAAVFEADDRLRERTQAALEGITTAGPRDSYRFHAMTADARVADAGVDSPDPGTGKVRVTILADNESGIADSALLETVRNALSAEHIRPLCDLVTVHPAEMIETPIVAVLHRRPGPAGEIAAATARAALAAWLPKTRRLAAGLPRSGIDAALHQPGIDRVEILSPAADILCDTTQCVRVTGVTLTEAVGNE